MFYTKLYGNFLGSENLGKECGNSDWKGDGHCDDLNNNEGCNWDGGDCCGPKVQTTYCSVCECLGMYNCRIFC